jgi:hypothetical protein
LGAHAIQSSQGNQHRLNNMLLLRPLSNASEHQHVSKTPHRMDCNNSCWLHARELQSHAWKALCNFLAIPTARFFLWELHCVIGDKWAGMVRMAPQSRRNLQFY